MGKEQGEVGPVLGGMGECRVAQLVEAPAGVLAEQGRRRAGRTGEPCRSRGPRSSAGHTNDRWRTRLRYEAFSQVSFVTLPVYGPM